MKTPLFLASKHNTEKSQPAALSLSNLIKTGGRKFLFSLKQKSLRCNNAWYRILSLDKRRFIDAVIQTVDKVQSALLLKILTAYAEKLIHVIGGIRGLIGNLAYGIYSYGQPLAYKISVIAQQWGNKTASTWAKDSGFIRYLTVNVMNISNKPNQ
jgi:hypothetical protein